MRHERPEPGRPTPIEPLNAELLRTALSRPGTAPRARANMPLVIPHGEVREAILADMVEILDEARISRGYAEIYDLKRAGYPDDTCSTLGPEAAKLLAKRVSDRLEVAARDNMEVA